MKERFSLIPAGSEDTASSRIRVYSLQRSLVSMGKVSTPGYWSEAEVLFIQKRLTRQLVAFAEASRKKGGVVIYDLDDLGEALTTWVPKAYVHRMVRIAQLVTTDTAGHRDALVGEYRIRNIEVIPDCVDYYPTGPVQPQAPPDGPLRILWFDSIVNSRAFNRYGNALAQLNDIQLVLVTHPNNIREYSKQYKSIEFHEWDRSNFVSVLQSCHLSCLVHESDAVGRAKSNNRMITSINWGVPALVSRTPEFARTAREGGVEYATFGNESELLAAIGRLRAPGNRMQYLRSAQPYVWQSYSPEVVARRFTDVVEKYSGHAASRATMRDVSAPRDIWYTAWLWGRITWDVLQENFPAARRVLGRARRAVKARLARSSGTAAAAPRTLNRRDYRALWVNPSGANYRAEVYERQYKFGRAPLVSNPTIDEVRSALRILSPDSVLEVGCGWGRLMEDLTEEFNIEGCDVSPETLARCKPGLTVFHFDIAVENGEFVMKNRDRWDVLFTRGVMLYITEPLQVAYSMNNMLMLAKKKIVIWEWPEVCEYMQQFSDSPKFEYHPIEHREE